MLPRLEVVRRLRPVSLLGGAGAGEVTGPVVAPYATAQARVAPLRHGRARVLLRSGADVLAGWLDPGGEVGLTVDGRDYRSRRHGRVDRADALALTLTGEHLCVWVEAGGRWQVHGRVGLREHHDVHDEAWCAALAADAAGVEDLRHGPFGQLGLRDVRLVTDADGAPARDGDRLLLTATHGGPGFPDAAHAGVWSLDPATYELEHRGSLFLRRPDRPGVYGDHAVHLLRDGGEWLVAASTWGRFTRSPGDVRVTLARSAADLTRGTHVLDTVALPLPADGARSVGQWDPHLVRDGDRWLVGYVSAERYFRFHPVLAAGPTLDRLSLVATDPGRRATEGTTLLRVDGALRVLASDGRDGRRGQRMRWCVLDPGEPGDPGGPGGLGDPAAGGGRPGRFVDAGTLEAPYPTNIPWPTLVRLDDRGGPDAGGDWLAVTFDGRPYGGPLAGYGTHGDLVLMTGSGAAGR